MADDEGTKYRTDYDKKITPQGIMDVYEASAGNQSFTFRMVRWAQDQGAKPKAKLAADKAAKVKPRRDVAKAIKDQADAQPAV